MNNGNNRSMHCLWAVCLVLAVAVVFMCGFSSPVNAEEASGISVGDHVFFGTYPQTADGTDNTPVEWRVLDVQDNQALLLSVYGLDVQPFNTEWSEDVTWENSTLRAWLNDDFLNRAFSPEEQSAIQVTTVENGAEQSFSGYVHFYCDDTQDRIFLLSYAEAHRYLKVLFWGIDDETNVNSRVAATDYAKHAGAEWRSENFWTLEGKKATWWWLRSPGYVRGNISRVIWRGSLCNRKANIANGCVRPSLWVNLASLSTESGTVSE